MFSENKYSILTFILSSVGSFVIINLFFYYFIKEKENTNITFEYIFNNELINYLKLDESNYTNILNTASEYGFKILPKHWEIASDEIYASLKGLYDSVTPVEIYDELVTNKQQLNFLNNEDTQQSRLSSKNVDKNQNKLILSYNFNNSDIAIIFNDNQNKIKIYLDRMLFSEINEIISLNNRYIDKINEYLNSHKIFCKQLFNMESKQIKKKKDSNDVTDKFKLSLNNLFEYYIQVESFCENKIQNFANFNTNKINKVILQKIISENNYNIKFEKIEKSQYFPIFILSFFVSITFGVFLSMLIFKFRKQAS